MHPFSRPLSECTSYQQFDPIHLCTNIIFLRYRVKWIKISLGILFQILVVMKLDASLVVTTLEVIVPYLVLDTIWSIETVFETIRHKQHQQRPSGDPSLSHTQFLLVSLYILTSSIVLYAHDVS
jgi:hypothetical protein